MAPITAQIRGNAALFASSLRLRLASGRATHSGNRNQGRLALWTPVLFADGIGRYFTLPLEPSLWWGIAALSASGLGAFSLHRRRGSAFFAMLASLIIAAGFTTVQVHNAAVMAPVLERKIGPVAVSGRSMTSSFGPRPKLGTGSLGMPWMAARMFLYLANLQQTQNAHHTKSRSAQTGNNNAHL